MENPELVKYGNWLWAACNSFTTSCPLLPGGWLFFLPPFCHSSSTHLDTPLFVPQVSRQCLLWSMSCCRCWGCSSKQDKAPALMQLTLSRTHHPPNCNKPTLLGNPSSRNSPGMSWVHCLYSPIMPNALLVLCTCVLFTSLFIIIWLMSVLIGCSLHKGSSHLVLLLLYFWAHQHIFGCKRPLWIVPNCLLSWLKYLYFFLICF